MNQNRNIYKITQNHKSKEKNSPIPESFLKLRDLQGYIIVGDGYWRQLCWWQLSDIGDGFGHLFHQHILSFHTSVGHQHSKIVPNLKSPKSRCHQYHCHHLQFGPIEKRRVLVSSGLCLGDPKLECIKSDQIVWPLNQTVIQLAQTLFVTSVFRTRVPWKPFFGPGASFPAFIRRIFSKKPEIGWFCVYLKSLKGLLVF